jgi:hypothetical protein
MQFREMQQEFSSVHALEKLIYPCTLPSNEMKLRKSFRTVAVVYIQVLEGSLNYSKFYQIRSSVERGNKDIAT